MEVICDQCGAKLSIRDERIPWGRLVRVSCPKCKNRIALNTESRGNPTRMFTQTEDRSEEVAESGYEYEDYEFPIDLYGEEKKVALVMEDDLDVADGLKKAVERNEYSFVLAKDTRDAVGKMRAYHFDLLILSDGFDGNGFAQSPILHYINHLSMSVRRRMFLVLIGEGLKTLDEMTAFAMSANLVVNREDLDKFDRILGGALSEHEKFYRVFFGMLTELGKV